MSYFPFVSLLQVENLSHDSLIKRAASLATDSSSTFLSQATLALIDAITDYSKVRIFAISLHLPYSLIQRLFKYSMYSVEAVGACAMLSR